MPVQTAIERDVCSCSEHCSPCDEDLRWLIAEVERLRGVLLSMCEWDAGYGGYQHNVALARVITEARAALSGETK
jgi:hypothetical protein